MDPRESVAEGEYEGHQPLAPESGPFALGNVTTAPIETVVANFCSMSIPPLELYNTIIKRFHWCHKMRSGFK